MKVNMARSKKAVVNLNQTTVTGDRSVTATFKAIARNPHREAVNIAYSIPLELSVINQK